MLISIRHHLLCCHQSPTRACVMGNDEVRRRWDTVASSRAEGSGIARSGDDGQPRGGRERGGGGQVNGGEARLTAGIDDPPTVLSGWSQQGPWSGLGAPHAPRAAGGPPAKRRDLSHTGPHVERGTPVSRP
jgi:hypothetical protein